MSFLMWIKSRYEFNLIDVFYINFYLMKIRLLIRLIRHILCLLLSLYSIFLYIKAKYSVQKNLAGVMFWTIDYDDFEGKFCGQGKYPLLTAVKDELYKSEEEIELYQQQQMKMKNNLSSSNSNPTNTIDITNSFSFNPT